MILVVIQKTTNVEPVSPAQHLLFACINILYRERCGCSFHFVKVR
jgi:hypothetical protein